MSRFLFFLTFVFAGNSMAALPQPQKLNKPTESLVGGQAGLGFSLLDLRSTKAGKKERLVIDVGGLNGSALKGKPGYFHAEILKNPHRLVIDFSQMPSSKMSLKDLRQRLAHSAGVKSANFSLDPIDQTLSLVLELKNNPKVKVYQVAGQKKTSKVVVDLIL